MKLVRHLLFTVLNLGVFLTFAAPSYAVVSACAMCVVAIGGGLSISRALGVDDAITGVWLGALLLALATASTAWIRKKFRFKFSCAAVIGYGSIYLLTIPFFIAYDLFSAGGYIWGISRLLFGMITGSAALLLGIYIDKLLRDLKPDHKVFFPFQKVVIPVILVLLGTLAVWLVL